MGFKLVTKQKVQQKIVDVGEINTSFMYVLLVDHQERSSIVESIERVDYTTSEEHNFLELSKPDDNFFNDIFVDSSKEAAKQHVLEELSGIILDKPSHNVADYEEEIIIDRRKKR